MGRSTACGFLKTFFWRPVRHGGGGPPVASGLVAFVTAAADLISSPSAGRSVAPTDAEAWVHPPGHLIPLGPASFLPGRREAVHFLG